MTVSLRESHLTGRLVKGIARGNARPPGHRKVKHSTATPHRRILEADIKLPAQAGRNSLSHDPAKAFRLYGFRFLAAAWHHHTTIR